MVAAGRAAPSSELHHAYKYGWLSARGRHRVLRVAQTIADLAGRERVSRGDVLLALSLRQRTGPTWPRQPMTQRRRE